MTGGDKGFGVPAVRMMPPSHPHRIVQRGAASDDEATMLRELLDNDDVTIALQAIVTLQAPSVVGWEALVRAKHPVHGTIPPTVIVEVARQHGMLDELTIRVGTLALDALWEIHRLLQERGEQVVDSRPVRMSINVELEQMYLTNPFIQWLLEQEIPAPGSFVIEVTERGVDEWAEPNERVAAVLTEKGYEMVLDDVGAGTSRIEFLRQRDWSIIKIDQRFLSWTTDRHRRLVELFVQLIHGMGMPSLAEGIETVEHLVFAQRLGITYGQGFWLGRPTPVEGVLADIRASGLAIETSF